MSRRSILRPPWHPALLVPVVLLVPAGAWGTTMISKQVTLDLVEVTVLDGPDDRLADETAWWEARWRATVTGEIDRLHVLAADAEAVELVGVPE